MALLRRVSPGAVTYGVTLYFIQKADDLFWSSPSKGDDLFTHGDLSKFSRKNCSLSSGCHPPPWMVSPGAGRLVTPLVIAKVDTVHLMNVWGALNLPQRVRILVHFRHKCLLEESHNQ